MMVPKETEKKEKERRKRIIKNLMKNSNFKQLNDSLFQTCRDLEFGLDEAIKNLEKFYNNAVPFEWLVEDIRNLIEKRKGSPDAMTVYFKDSIYPALKKIKDKKEIIDKVVEEIEDIILKYFNPIEYKKKTLSEKEIFLGK